MKKLLTSSISHDLFLRMIGFGFGMGLIFPFFTFLLLDLPAYKVFNPLFFALCVTAGITVGVCNYFLFKKVVDLYLRQLQTKISGFRLRLKDLLWKKDTEFNQEDYLLQTDSADTIGMITREYNIFMSTLYRLLSSERKTATFLENLQKQVGIEVTAQTIVESFKDYFGADGGCLYKFENGLLEKINNCHLLVDDQALDQNYCYEIIKRGEIVVFEDIDNLPIRFNIGIGAIKPNAVAYLPLTYQFTQVGLCILSAHKDFKADFFSLESRNLINQAAPFLYNSILMKKLETLAAIDELTGLLNRRYGMKRLYEEFERAHRHQQILSVAMLDIDDFKQINDVYGHQAGDQILREFADIIKEEIRVSEFALRYGGEEFMVVTPGASSNNCHRIMERLRRKVESLEVKFQKHNLKFTFSAGVAAYPEGMISNQPLLIQAADAALYQAKRQGKNKVVIYSGEFELRPEPKA
ncbi:MAG: GGDEF domain-containing protein [Deltaproteobacteria bacterium]|nr:GGDEF domain-containing protein [Deltaproteobacteria bacterium]